MILYAISVLILVLCCGDLTKGAYSTKATFPASNSTIFPRLRLTDPLPSLKEFTVCSWTRDDILQYGSIQTILSYATENNDNELCVYSHILRGDILIRLHVNSNHADFNCSGVYQNLGIWQHVCVTWFGPDGNTNVYINGEQCADTKTLSAGKSVKGGGVVVIGQEQDKMDSTFDRTQSWIGDIAELHMWNEVLNKDVIWEAGKCDVAWTNGNIISWLETPMTAHDGVILTETQLCKS